MKRLTDIFCVWLICTGFLPAAGITGADTKTMPLPVAVDTMLDSVAVAGVDGSLRDEIISILLSRRGGLLNEGLVEHDVNAVTNYLREQGWWNASVTAAVDSSSEDSVILIFDVSAGKPLFFGLVTPLITDEVNTTVPVFFGGHYGSYFSKHLLENIVNDVLSYFAGGGYPDVTVIPSLSAHGDTVDVVLNINAGQQAHIDSIVVRGLLRTKDYVIRRELSSLLGKPAGTDVVGDAVSLAERLDFVRIENPPLIEYDDEGNGILVVTLAERGQNSFDGVVGYQPAAGGGSGEMVGKIDLGFANMFGTGRSSRIRWENLGSNTEDLEIRYREPWIFGYPYAVSAAFLQEERENRGYIKTLISAGIGRHIGRLHIDSGFNYEKVSADTLHSTKAAGVEIGATWSAVDNPVNPSKGIRYGAVWSMASKRYRFGPGEKTRSERVEFDLDHYIPVLSRQTVAVLMRYRRINIPLKNLAPSDRYWLGGASTIRGYNESMSPAVKALWSNIEYRFLTGRASRVFVFVDTGYLENREKSQGKFLKKTQTLAGYGFGLRIESGAGVLGFDYGLARGDSPGEGKLHVMMRTEF